MQSGRFGTARHATVRAVSRVTRVAFLLLGLASCRREGGPRTIDDLGVDQTIRLNGLSDRVDVVRDKLGRPHLYASSEEDLARVVGWLHAEDRFVQMDLQRRFAGGTVAELVGALVPEAVQSDERMRAIGLARTAQQIYDGLPAGSDLKEMLDAYAEGVNAKLATFNEPPAPEYDIFGYPFEETPPWTPVDSLTVGRLLSFTLAWDGDAELAMQEAVDAFSAAFPEGDARAGIVDDLVLRIAPTVPVSIVDPDLELVSASGASSRSGVRPRAPISREVVRGARAFAEAVLHDRWNPLRGIDNGSNNWVVGGSRTKSDHPLLANDPHLGIENPPVWYEVHLDTQRAGGDYEVVGVSLPGVPLVILGANDSVAWAMTNHEADVTDVFVERYSVGTGAGGVDQVEWDADGPGGESPAYVDLVKEEHVIQRRIDAETVENLDYTVWRTAHRNGVVIPGSVVAGTALSWAWTGFEATNEMAAIHGLSRATSAAEVVAAAADFEVPNENLVYADVAGNIGYVANGLYPVRADDDGDLHTDPPLLPVPGYDGAHEWIGWVAAGDVPAESNPVRGWIASANNDPLGHSFDNDPFDDPVYIGSNVHDIGFRAARISEVLDDASEFTVGDMQALQGDHVSNVGRRMLPFLLESLGDDFADEAALLEGWSTRGFRAASGVGDDVPSAEVDDAAATSLFNIWLYWMLWGAFGDEMEAAESWLGDQELLRGAFFLLEHPTEAATYDETTQEPALWDDVTTGPVESRDEIFVEAFENALDWLASDAGFDSSDPDDWRWGLLHRLVIARVSTLSNYDIPDPFDPELGDGFPRHGDLYNVDVGNWSIYGTGFGYTHGASMRLVVDLTPGRVRVFNALPGGASADPANKHFDDQATRYAANRSFEFWSRERDVAGHAERRILFLP